MRDLPIIIANTVTFVFAAMIVVMKIVYSRRK